MVDSLRADRMQVYGYDRPTTPFLTGLLKTGRLKKVETALSTCADTNCGVMATLASILPAKQIPQSFKLPDLLRDQGYDLFFVLAGNHSNWYDLKKAYGEDVDHYFDGSNSTRYDWNDDRVITEGLERVPSFSGTPAFLYFHLMSAHSMGIKRDEYQIYKPAKNWINLPSESVDPLAATNYYDNGVVQADASIEGIFGILKQKGYLENSVVVILGDHGEALGPPDHSYYGHIRYLFQEFIRIPILIYEDAAPNYRNLEFATQLDVAPTIVDRLGLTVPPSWRGHSLVGFSSDQSSFHQTATNPASYAVVYKTERTTYKYLVHNNLGEALYELRSDPRERNNLISAADPELVQLMREKLRESRANP
jgi:glucan phosphoethanolaminetransferase (alkaline phosphatase superfamily)